MKCLCQFALVALLVPSGCIIDTVPLPEATGRGTPDDVGITGFVNTNAMFYTSGPSILVGTEAAVTPMSRVIILNPARSGWQGEADSAANGSFYIMPLDAATGDELQVNVMRDDVVIASARLLLEDPSVDASKNNDDLDALVSGAPSDGDPGPPDSSSGPDVAVSPPDLQGMVTVLGQAGTLAPGIAVVVANITAGNATVAQVAVDGSFAARLAAQSGDELSMFAVEPASSNAGTTPISILVP